MNKPRRPQFITDSSGRRKSVVLRMKEYNELLEHLEELEDVAEIKKRRNEKSIPYSQVRKELGLA